MTEIEQALWAYVYANEINHGESREKARQAGNDAVVDMREAVGDSGAG
jgi:hypothetical protein